MQGFARAQADYEAREDAPAEEAPCDDLDCDVCADSYLG